MDSPKKIKEGIRVSVVLSKEQVNRIQYRVLRMSLQAGRTIGIPEGVRCALEVTYPENIKISARPHIPRVRQPLRIFFQTTAPKFLRF